MKQEQWAYQASSAHDLAGARAERAALLPSIPCCGLGHADGYTAVTSAVAASQVAAALQTVLAVLKADPAKG